jgi:hypothetical protein
MREVRRKFQLSPKHRWFGVSTRIVDGLEKEIVAGSVSGRHSPFLQTSILIQKTGESRIINLE